MSQGYIYFFQAPETEDARVKIGRSTDPQHRHRSLSYETGQRLTIVGVMPSDEPIVEEATIHREFAEHHIEGEWFKGAVVTELAVYRHRFLAKLPATQRLVQVWVPPDFHAACVVQAKSEGRSLANWFRCQLDKIIEAAEAAEAAEADAGGTLKNMGEGSK